MEGHIGTCCQIWEQNPIVWTSSAVHKGCPRPLPNCLCCSITQQKVHIRRNAETVSTETVQWIPWENMHLKPSLNSLAAINFWRVLRISSHKNLEILIFGFANFWSYIMLTVLSVCVLVACSLLAEALEDTTLFLVSESICVWQF